MTGKSKYAEQMAKHLNEPIEAACAISRPGGTTAQVRVESAAWPAL